jgi:hypothetical protein
MKNDIIDVVADWVKAPQLVFETKRRIDKREVLRGNIGREPYSKQSVGGAEQLIICDVFMVIPEKRAFYGGAVCQKAGARDNDTTQKYQ